MAGSAYQYGTSPRKIQPEYSPKKRKGKKTTKKTTKIKKQEQQKKNEKMKQEKIKHYKNIAVIIGLFLVLLTVSYRNSLITERFNQIQNKKQELSSIQKSNGQTEVSIESSLNLKNLENSAKDKLGMQKLENDQKVYVELPKKDYTESATPEVEEEKNKALHFAQLAYERQRLDIINKYNDEVFEKQKAELDREYQLLEKQLERNRRLYDTSNLREPKQISYQTTYNQNPLPLGLGRNWMSVYQSKDDVERQYKDQVAYNNKILELTQIRINKENELLNEEINTLTNKAKVLQEQLNSTDLNDLDRRREIVDQLADIDDTLFTNKQTLAQNEIALDNAVLDNEEANLDAYLDMQDKKRQALEGVLDVVSSASGSLASMFRMEANNDKKSEEQRKRALKAYKAFAITQAIADT